MQDNNLTNKTISGMIWKFAERIGSQLVTTIVSIILARILMPEDYGLISLITIFITLCDVFISSGFGNALIQKKDADEEDFSSVFYASLGISVILYFVLFFSAPFIAQFYENELIIVVLRVMGLRLPIAAVYSVQQAYVSRKMQFRKFFLATLIGTVISGGVGIGMAYGGLGVWALVGQNMTNVFVNMIVLFLAVSWRPKRIFSLKKIKSLLSYGWKLLASGLLDTGYNELRGLIIGKMYSTSDLAFYDQGKKYPSLIANNINSSMNSVLLSAMAKRQADKEKVKQATRKSIRLSGYLLMPCMIGLACVAEQFVKVLLTDKWLPAVPFIQIMCIVYAFYPIHTANLTAIQAMGRSDLFLILEIIKKVVGIAGLLISMWFGVFWIAATMMITTVISSFINAFPNKKLFNYSYLEQLKDMLPALGLSVAMGLPVYLMNFLPVNSVVILCLQVATGIVLYVGFSVIFKVESFFFLWGFIKNLFCKKTRKGKNLIVPKSVENRSNVKREFTREQLSIFLNAVDKDFSVPLSQKQNLTALTDKFYDYGTLFAEVDDGKIISLVAGYTDNVINDRAYLSVVATLEEGRGRGLAPMLINRFIDFARVKGLNAVHLYTDQSNVIAIKMYKELGFKVTCDYNEPRPDDVHFIYYLKDI